MPLPDPSKSVPENLLRNELPRDISINKQSNINKELDGEEIYTQTGF